jgi:sortase A
MKKAISIILACALCMTPAVPAFAAYNYDFSTGDDTLPGFGKSTSNDDPVSPDPMSENTRRNKDAAYNPPPYFYGSGDIPTDPSSPYHDNTPGGTSSGYGGTTGNTIGNTSSVTLPSSGFEESTSTVASNTEPLYYSDGSIGTIYFARTGKTIKVYEGEQLDNLKKGAGHFASTPAWDGNVALCGHNRGSSPYFSFVKDMQIGDKVTYTTRYGSRTYEVYNKEQINEYDYSKLGWSAENLLTLITCIADTPEQRFAAQLREVR